MPDIHTPYGKVDAAALEALRETFDTTAILRLVEQLDVIRSRYGDPNGLRDDLLCLHGMAHTVVNGARLSYTATGPTLVDLADDVLEELDDWIAVLKRAVQALQPLQQLHTED